MKKNYKAFLMTLFLCSGVISSFAQIRNANDTIININASEYNLSYEQEKNQIWAGQAISQFQPSLIILNKKIYEGRYGSKILALIPGYIKKVEVVKDKTRINHYSSNSAVQSVLLIKVKKRDAKTIYNRLKQMKIISIGYN